MAYCTKSGYGEFRGRGLAVQSSRGLIAVRCPRHTGTRIIPPGTIHGAQWLKTKEYIQIVGMGDLTKINVKPRDAGGELDPYGGVWMAVQRGEALSVY